MARLLILKMSNEKLWYNETGFIAVQNTNLPVEFMAFRESRPIFWLVDMKEFDRNSGALSVSVLDYDLKKTEPFSQQSPKTAIQLIKFVACGNTNAVFDWEKLEPLLTWYHRINFENTLYNQRENEKRIYERHGNSVAVKERNEQGQNDDNDFVIREKFAVEIHKCTFVLGGVKFSKRIARAGRVIDFEVANDDILPEFDLIKYWFAKRLKRKKFTITAEVVVNGDKLVAVNAFSDDINAINRDFIEGVKIQRTLGFPGFRKDFDPDKSLFTADEFFSPENDELSEGNVFGQGEEDLINIFLENSNVRNKKELIYLSGKVHSEYHKIRFSNYPHFGFIFLFQGEECNHFIWELLNSNATYIWSVEKHRFSVENQYKKLEKIIGLINIQGRDPYKRQYQSSPNSDDFVFNLVYHRDKKSAFVDGFPRWKCRVQELLV